MDKLKAFFGKLKKHHFWVLTGMVLILSFSVWYLATTDLAAQTATNRQTINEKFDLLRKIVATTNPPNEKFEQGTRALETSLRKDVDKAWTLVYADQKSKVLKWPAELGDEVLQWLDDPANHNAEIPSDYRETYMNYVMEELLRLLAIVDARPWWDLEEDELGGTTGTTRRQNQKVMSETVGRRASMPVVKKDYKMIWDKKHQKAFDESLEFPKGLPSSAQIRLCQENVWVYNALVRAIAYVNKDVTGIHNAKIKKIIAINVGQDASDLLKQSLEPGLIKTVDGAVGQTGGAPAMLSEEGGRTQTGAPAREMEMERSVTMGGEGAAGGMGGKPLDDKRYVDDKGIPMPAGSAGPEEFKRIPIVMQLYMDQREIAKLLVRLANSSLPVEIRQLRINTKMQGFSDPRPMMFGGGMESGGAGGGRKSAAVIKMDNMFKEAMQFPYDVAVELHGIIYIFNPPSPKLLQEIIVAEGDSIPSDKATATEVEPQKEKEASTDRTGTESDPVEDSADQSKKSAEPADKHESGSSPDTTPSDEKAAQQETKNEEGAVNEDAPAERPASKKPATKQDDEAPFGEEG